MANSQAGQTALITGASSGLGASFAEFLASKGVRVFLTARREKRLAKLQEMITANGGQAAYFAADLSIESSREELFRRANSTYREVNILINNAGFGWYGYFNDMGWNLARDMIAVNIASMAHLTKLFLPGMLERRHGHIINIGSIAGGLPNQGIVMYSGSKAFLDAFSTALYRELRGTGVTASVMRLGAVKTEFYDYARALENGRSIPAEKLAVSVDVVTSALWRLLKHPKRVVYVPRWLFVSRILECAFGRLIDLLGPLLLKNRSS